MPALRIPSLDIFRHRLFALFWAARWFGTLAIQMQLAAMFWQIYDTARIQGHGIREGALTLGLVGLAQFLPLLALSLFGGQAADRYNRRFILILCFGMKALIALGLAVAAQYGAEVVVPAVFVAAILAGATNAFMPPAATALLPMLLPREDLPQGIAMSSLAFQSALIIGPALGGWLCVFTSMKKGKANSAENSAPPMYTGRLPTLSESQEKNGMVSSCTAYASMLPCRTIGLGRCSCCVM